MTTLIVKRSRKSISLTALIDVVFILLMFFMLTSSFSQWKEIDIDSATAAIGTVEQEPELLVVANDGSIHRYNETSAQELSVLLESLRPDAPVVLLPEASASVQQIVDALQQLKALGLQGLSLGQPLPRT